MPDDQAGHGQIAVSPNNPCPFLRALVANGYVGGHIVPLSKDRRNDREGNRRNGRRANQGVAGNLWVAVIANGLKPLRQLKSAMTGAVLDELRDGPLDKHGAGSRILDVEAQVHEDEIDRLATFGRDRPDGAGGVERGLNAKEIETYMAANIKRAEETNSSRWFYPILMKGEWPVLLNILGKGEGDERYLSVAEVRTLFVERRFPDRIVARLPEPPIG